MTRLLTTLAVLSVLLVAGTTNAAPIDPFTAPPGGITFGNGTPTPLNTLTLLDSQPITGILGGTRELYVTNLTGNSFGNEGLTVGPSPNPPLNGNPGFDYSSASATKFTAELRYLFPTTSFSPFTNLTLDVASINFGNNQTSIPGEIQIFDGATSSIIVPFALSGTGLANLASFSQFTGFDLSSVDRISVRFNTSPGITTGVGADFTLRGGDNGLNLNIIPEPTTIAICGLFGVAGLIGARRKLKKATEPTVAA